MYRDKLEELKEWQKSENRKPLILNGARQVGKTWLLEEFGRQCYERTARIDLADNQRIATLFEGDFDIERIVDGLELYSGVRIEPENTLLILDEVQSCPRALESLKYFYEKAPGYHVAVAGSLLGITLSEGSFPVGKVNTLNLYPLSFTEFLRAINKTQYAEAIKAGEAERLAPFHSLLLDYLKVYLAVGGMPEAVATYVRDGNLLGVRKVQEEIVLDYERDFAKHAPVNIVPKIQEIFRIIPRELAKENKKFLFSMLRAGARASEYEAALLWLEDAGVATRVNRVETVKLPLSAYYEQDAFKLYLVDVGLLGAMARLDPKVILDSDEMFVEFKGALAEQFVFQELVGCGRELWYYRKDKPTREVDFLLEDGARVVPIEVKSGSKTYAKSFGEFVREHGVTDAYKISQAAYRLRGEGSVDYVPLYMVEGLGKMLGEA